MVRRKKKRKHHLSSRDLRQATGHVEFYNGARKLTEEKISGPVKYLKTTFYENEPSGHETVPEKTITMINALSKKHALFVFNPNTDSYRANLCHLRKRLADTQKNPRFKQIHLHTFRHFFTTEKLKQTKML